MRRAAAAAALAVALMVGAASATVSRTSTNTDGTDGRISAIAFHGRTIYVAGSFTSTNGGGSLAAERQAHSRVAAISASTGNVIASWSPTVNGTVHALAVSPNGSDVYIGGEFTAVNGVTRYRLARISAAGQPDAGRLEPWNPNMNGIVRALALNPAGSRLFVGGSFTYANAWSAQRRFLAAVETATDRAVATWRADTSAEVRSLRMAPNGSAVYVGGQFNTIGGITQPRLARVSAETGAPDRAFTPRIPWNTSRADDPSVYSLALSTDGVAAYAALHGSPSFGNRMLAVATASGAELWRARTPDGDVQAVAATSSDVYVGGHFRYYVKPSVAASVQCEPPTAECEWVKYLAAFDPVTGARRPWSVNPAHVDSPTKLGIWALVPYRDSVTGWSSLLVGGDFRSWNGAPRLHLASLPGT